MLTMATVLPPTTAVFATARLSSTATTSCIQETCTGSDLTNAEAASQSLCAAVGVTLTTSSATATATQSSNGTTTTATPSSSNAASSHTINIFTGAAAFAILAASL
ncbi:hypothetical protein EDD22DRAFT_974111 [Suillus occidentalis]|nr:hypothetical protein EDD22DRAFT_974111 [Suillus occidentalis]